MKILHAVSGWPPEHVGEIELYVQRLARAQVALGHTVAIAAGSGSDRYTGGFRRSADGADGIAVHRISQTGTLPERWDHSAAPHVAHALGDLLDETAPDVLHVHQWTGLTRSLVRRAARAGIPSVLTLHDAAATCPRDTRVRPDDPCCELPPGIESCRRCVPQESWAATAVVAEEIGHYFADMQGELSRAAALVCASRAQAQLLARHAGIAERSLQVVPLPSSVEWSVDASFEPGPPWAPGCGRPLRLAHWGTLGTEAGSFVLLEALRLLDRHAELELTAWGAADAALERELAALPRELTVQRRPDLRSADLRELRADLAVLPALRHEGHGYALDAALALRLPAVVSDRGAPAERLGSGGLVAPAGSAAGLAERLADVLDGRARLADLRAGLPAARTVAEHWTELEPLYAGAVARGPARADARAGQRDGDMDDRERWERIARAYEDQCRDSVGLRGAAEREVRGLRRDASDAFARMHEALARTTAAASELRALKVRLAARSAEANQLRVREAERGGVVRELEARLMSHLAKLMELEGLLTQKELEHAERETQREDEIRLREERIRKLERENRLALPLVWPARGLLWIWDRLKK